MFSRIEIEKYFKAEKRENFLLMIIGILSVILATLLFFGSKEYFNKGAGASLMLMGIVLCITKFIQFTRNDMLHVINIHNLEMQPSVFKTSELPRMKTIIKHYHISRNIKVILLMTGILLFCYSCIDLKNDFLRGCGLSLSVMSFITLIADLLAIRRGNKYLNHLESFTSAR